MKWVLGIAVFLAATTALILFASRGEDGPHHTLEVGQSYRNAEMTAIQAGYTPYPDPQAVPSTPQGFAVTLPDSRKLIVYRDPRHDRVISMLVKLPALSKEGEWVYRTIDSFDLPDRTTPPGQSAAR